MNTFKITALAAAATALLGLGTAARAAEYANVISSTPVTSSVAVPRQECADGERVVQRAPSGAGSLIGAIVGGVVGNQFGAGFGRAAATGLGVVAGSAIGNQAEVNNTPAVAVPVRSCRTVSQYENRVVGYDVVYEYNGQRYNTRTSYDPGTRLAIDVRPQAAPSTSYQAVPPAYNSEPAYVESPAPYYAPAPIYYGPGPGYYAPPVIGVGIYGGYGWRHGYYGYHRWH